MSDQGRYRKLYTRLWRHPGFVGLSEGEKVLTFYVLTGPQTNRLGLFLLSIATAAEDLGTSPETIKKRLANVCLAFSWMFDATARVLYIPTWFKFNPPENCNVLKGNLKDLNELPPCGLLDAFAANLEHIPDLTDKSGRTLHQTFFEGLRQRLPKGGSTQEQYQDLQKQEQKTAALRAGALAERGRTSHGAQPNDQPIRIARETVSENTRDADVELLVDDLMYRARVNNVSTNRVAAVMALTLARAS